MHRHIFMLGNVRCISSYLKIQALMKMKKGLEQINEHKKLTHWLISFIFPYILNSRKYTAKWLPIVCQRLLARGVHELQQIFPGPFPDQIIFCLLNIHLDFFPSDWTSWYIFVVRGGIGRGVHRRLLRFLPFSVLFTRPLFLRRTSLTIALFSFRLTSPLFAAPWQTRRQRRIRRGGEGFTSPPVPFVASTTTPRAIRASIAIRASMRFTLVWFSFTVFAWVVPSWRWFLISGCAHLFRFWSLRFYRTDFLMSSWFSFVWRRHCLLSLRRT